MFTILIFVLDPNLVFFPSFFFLLQYANEIKEGKNAVTDAANNFQPIDDDGGHQAFATTKVVTSVRISKRKKIKLCRKIIVNRNAHTHARAHAHTRAMN